MPNPQYKIFRVLPAMDLKDPIHVGPVVFCTSLHFSQFSLSADPQLAGLQELAKNFYTVQGKVIGRIGAILLPQSDFNSLLRCDFPRMARDALAFCHVADGNRSKANNSSYPVVFTSDYFDIMPVSFKNGKFLVHSPGLRSAGNDTSRYKPVFPIHLPHYDHRGFRHDDLLLQALVRGMDSVTKRKNSRQLRQVFRALALAFHAARTLHEPDSNVHDLGTKIMQWVSAFETLVHPGHGRVGVKDVVALIESIEWSKRIPKKYRTPQIVLDKKYLSDRRFTRTWKDKAGTTHRTRECAPTHYYRQVYDLRNSLAHGNKITRSAFSVFGHRKGYRVDLPLPLLFRQCVLQRLRQLKLVSPPPTGNITTKKLSRAVPEYMNFRKYEEPLARLLLTMQKL